VPVGISIITSEVDFLVKPNADMSFLLVVGLYPESRIPIFPKKSFAAKFFWALANASKQWTAVRQTRIAGLGKLAVCFCTCRKWQRTAVPAEIPHRSDPAKRSRPDQHERPFADIELPSVMLRCGPSNRTFVHYAATLLAETSVCRQSGQLSFLFALNFTPPAKLRSILSGCLFAGQILLNPVWDC